MDDAPDVVPCACVDDAAEEVDDPDAVEVDLDEEDVEDVEDAADAVDVEAPCACVLDDVVALLLDDVALLDVVDLEEEDVVTVPVAGEAVVEGGQLGGEGEGRSRV